MCFIEHVLVLTVELVYHQPPTDVATLLRLRGLDPVIEERDSINAANEPKYPPFSTQLFYATLPGDLADSDKFEAWKELTEDARQLYHNEANQLRDKYSTDWEAYWSDKPRPGTSYAEKRGFVVYRTTYGDEAKWKAAQEFLGRHISQKKGFGLRYVENKEWLNNADIDNVRT